MKLLETVPASGLSLINNIWWGALATPPSTSASPQFAAQSSQLRQAPLPELHEGSEGKKGAKGGREQMGEGSEKKRNGLP